MIISTKIIIIWIWQNAWNENCGCWDWDSGEQFKFLQCTSNVSNNLKKKKNFTSPNKFTVFKASNLKDDGILAFSLGEQ